ncbi:hypothetical protein AS188_05435 [Kocuria flava]|uniref:Fimbrial assembly protein FimA n=1 Tax=Kocuria flava TaxID=446860 RepID=A0A0U3HEP7_9MICC|nr:DUF1028 domain-containing protein [Kocuria flava]ALU39288.1 hypothetical protein AS188_05435 [Kocuria flava]PLC11089.1 hypothetical protein AUQ48_01010 [Kocuria flava]GEO92143.1 hypothetical protein KFL01_14490 [Kocuria flava]
MTYTVIARTADSRLLGAATASCSLAVGNAVPALVPTAGVVASQAWTNRRLRFEMLRGLHRGRTAEEAIAGLADVDADLALRQVAALPVQGPGAHQTGGLCTPWAGGTAGQDFVVIGNYLAGPEVVDAMGEAAARALAVPALTSLELGRALVACLRAGQDAGGDSRGQQSAAVVVADTLAGFQYPVLLDVDLRADDSAAPLDDLDRMLELKARAHPAPAEVVPRTQVPPRPEDEQLWSTVLS